MTDEVRGVGRLALTATHHVTDLVEEMHRAIVSGPDVLGRPLERQADELAKVVFGGVRLIARAVGAGAERSFAALAPWVEARAPGPRGDAVRAVMNGVFGDHLAATGNPLAITMRLRREGRPLTLEPAALAAALPDAGGKPLVLIHGSSANDRQWLRGGHEHGAALARDLGYTPVWLHYNSGLHISTNGRQLAGLLEELVNAWPTPIEGLTLLGHSMGGLVARSACHVAEAEGHAWRGKLRKLAFLGTPHHGAPLERAGNLVHALLGVTKYSAPFKRLARIRSAGVTDLRYGYVLDEHWQGRDRFATTRDPRGGPPLPAGVECYALAATTAKELKRALPGDGLVPVKSALGVHRASALTLGFSEENQHVALATWHLDLLSSPAVYEVLRGWLAAG